MRPRIKCYLKCITLFFCVILILKGYCNVSFCWRLGIKKIVMMRSLNFTETVIENTRSMINIETRDYNFTHSGVNDIEELVMESGGTPLRSLIVSTWRSGSSFLGDLLNAMPGNFYNYEPLMIYDNQIKLPHAINATRILKDMFTCNFAQAWNGNIEYFAYVKKIKKDVNQIEHNRRLWSKCSFKEELLCYDAQFVSKLCKLFPFQSMKVIRFRLTLAEPLLDDKKLNVRVVLLVRDPRAVMHSRRNFCKGDCYNPNLLCLDMLDDYIAAAKFIQKYPDKLVALRFEDLISDLNGTTNQLLKFLRLGGTPSIDKFLLTHTNVNNTDKFSTFRVSRQIPFNWKTAMNYSQVEKIQRVCGQAMSKWGYEVAHNASHMKSTSFYPILNSSRTFWRIPRPTKDETSA